MAGKVKVWGPHRDEAAHAYRVAIAADKFLNAYLENKVTADLVRDLAIELSELENNTAWIIESWTEREAELMEVDFSKAQWDAERQACWVEENVVEEGDASGTPQVDGAPPPAIDLDRLEGLDRRTAELLRAKPNFLDEWPHLGPYYGPQRYVDTIRALLNAGHTPESICNTAFWREASMPWRRRAVYLLPQLRPADPYGTDPTPRPTDPFGHDAEHLGGQKTAGNLPEKR